jgi:hypothetical protein
VGWRREDEDEEEEKRGRESEEGRFRGILAATGLQRVWRWKSVFQRRGLFSTVNAPALLHGHGIWTVVVVQMLLCHDRISGM